MTSTKTFACCNKIFGTRGNYKRHVETVHPAPVGMLCGKFLKPRKDNIKRHRILCKKCKYPRSRQVESQRNPGIESETVYFEDLSPGFSAPCLVESIIVEGNDQHRLNIASTAGSIYPVWNYLVIPADAGTQAIPVDGTVGPQMPPSWFNPAVEDATMERGMTNGNGKVEDTSTYPCSNIFAASARSAEGNFNYHDAINELSTGGNEQWPEDYQSVNGF
ncbi:hypothetical protein CMEL01_10853 [Colletotrichum melonis]|uniref:Uncharacterized protein n=1 Tax=Colletotrichum melonis TaxID=1209925 RepID=A0AAI9UYH1_9PEZI|nr:hypothetical protein CMEL01_10853 [Colletotrichum melonis]